MSQNKKRKIDNERRVFNDNWNVNYFFIEYFNKAMCLIYIYICISRNHRYF